MCVVVRVACMCVVDMSKCLLFFFFSLFLLRCYTRTCVVIVVCMDEVADNLYDCGAITDNRAVVWVTCVLVFTEFRILTYYFFPFHSYLFRY